jgi:hypothetical protein
MNTLLAAIPDYLIYILLPLILAFRTYKDIHVGHSKGIYNIVEFWVYVLTLLTAAMVFRVGEVGFLALIVAIVFLLMAFLEVKEVGRIEEIVKQGRFQPSSTEQEPKKQKETIPPVLRKMRINFLFSFSISVLSFLNFFDVFNFLS